MRLLKAISVLLTVKVRRKQWGFLICWPVQLTSLVKQWWQTRARTEHRSFNGRLPLLWRMSRFVQRRPVQHLHTQAEHDDELGFVHTKSSAGRRSTEQRSATRFRCSHTSRAARPVPDAMEEFVSYEGICEHMSTNDLCTPPQYMYFPQVHCLICLHPTVVRRSDREHTRIILESNIM